MTAAAEALNLRLPRPLPHQQRVLLDPSPRKLWRAGRRTGKSVAGRVAGIRGHGPKGPDGRRTLRGMLDGGNIVWLTKTYKQSKVVWRKLLKAFRPLEGRVVVIDREERRVEMRSGHGALTVWSGHTRDAIDNIRGEGFDGCLLDEAAYIDAEYAINDVIEPALLDNGGWVFVFSSPSASWDGNERRETPSYFNRLCALVLTGVETLWTHWHNRTEDNPRLDQAALARLRERLGPDSPTAQQELDASLSAGGLLALQIDRARVLVPQQVVPAHWTKWASYDFGYQHPASFVLWATDEDGTSYIVDSVRLHRKLPVEQAALIGARLKLYGLTFPDLRYTVAGHDCWHEHKAHGETVPTIAEQVWKSAKWAMRRASIDRVLGLNNMREYLRSGRFKVMDTPDNLELLRVLETRISDPKRPEDVLKVDADVDGHGGDDPYDATRYGLASRPIKATAPALPLEQGRALPREQMVRGRTPAGQAGAVGRAGPVPAARPQPAAVTGAKRPTFRPALRGR